MRFQSGGRADSNSQEEDHRRSSHAIRQAQEDIHRLVDLQQTETLIALGQRPHLPVVPLSLPAALSITAPPGTNLAAGRPPAVLPLVGRTAGSLPASAPPCGMLGTNDSQVLSFLNPSSLGLPSPPGILFPPANSAGRQFPSQDLRSAPNYPTSRPKVEIKLEETAQVGMQGQKVLTNSPKPVERRIFDKEPDKKLIRRTSGTSVVDARTALDGTGRDVSAEHADKCSDGVGNLYGTALEGLPPEKLRTLLSAGVKLRGMVSQIWLADPEQLPGSIRT